jgi:hypothetical protein
MSTPSGADAHELSLEDIVKRLAEPNILRCFNKFKERDDLRVGIGDGDVASPEDRISCAESSIPGRYNQYTSLGDVGNVGAAHEELVGKIYNKITRMIAIPSTDDEGTRRRIFEVNVVSLRFESQAYVVSCTLSLSSQDGSRRFHAQVERDGRISVPDFSRKSAASFEPARLKKLTDITHQICFSTPFPS